MGEVKSDGTRVALLSVGFDGFLIIQLKPSDLFRNVLGVDYDWD